MRKFPYHTLVLLVISSATPVFAEQHRLNEQLHHLRIDGPREWTEFPISPDASHIELKFKGRQNTTEYSLRLRQQDVKQRWNVLLNGKEIGRLRGDENDMVVYFSVPPKSLVDGENVLRIEQDMRRRKTPDDIRVGEIVLDSRPTAEVLDEATVEMEVVDADSKQNLPARITVINSDGALQTPGATSNDHLAVRPGTIYTSRGKAHFGLPAGKYTIFAGRGFEYSLASTKVTLASGDNVKKKLTIHREVPTAGYVACDTHVHTLTHSGHGDASVDERMITLAAEAVELPIATDHNVHIDHNAFARKMNVRQYFTPVIGNEVTTRIGHFNVFPVRAGAKIPDYKLTDWKSILDDIYRTPDVKVAILNHARDVHGGMRPFGPKLHNALVGENVEGWPIRFNAMEVINSGATQTDALQLCRDWMSLLNRGHIITPVGSSDSHDVARHFVGQGRTYIRCNDRNPGKIDVDEAVNNFLQGRVMVSYGLLAELTVDGKYRSGELAPVPNENVTVSVRVLGPHWTTATSVALYANGNKIRETEIPKDALRDLPAGVKWRGEWSLPKPKHDVHLVAIAVGPGIDGLYWSTAKAYQPTSPDWKASVFGCSGAVWLDVDGDGRRTAAYDYATRIFAMSGGDLPKLIAGLADHDQAVAAQAAHMYQKSGGSLITAESQTALKTAADATKEGFYDYLNTWRETQAARSTSE